MAQTRAPVEDARRSIEIPTHDGSEVVEVLLDELPDEADEICELLLAEAAPVSLFHQFALEYYRRGHKRALVELLKRGIAESTKTSAGDANRAAAQLYSTLSAHYIHEGLQCPPQDRRHAIELLEEATHCLNEAERRSPASDAHGIRKGLLLLAKNTLEAAGYQFKFCLDKASESVPALLGQACVFFFLENYRPALAVFQTILRGCPQLNEVRRAIGHCFLQLGHMDLALRAFLRVLDVDPTDEAAMVAVGFLHLTRKDDGAALQSGLLRMKEVYGRDRTNPVALIHLANHFFFKKDFVKARALVDSALLHASVDRIRGEAHFILAKIAHAANNFTEAFGSYQQSVKLAPDFLPAQFGLGQCLLARGDHDAALSAMERILQREPTCPEALRLAALLHVARLARETRSATDELHDRARAATTRALLAHPSDPLLLQSAATLSEPVRALSLYEQLLRDHPAVFTDHFALLNNLVVLRHAHGEIADGVELLSRAEQLAQSSQASLSGFIAYNRARLAEDDGRIREAETLYRGLLERDASLASCHLRLGILSLRRGQLAEAADHFKDVLGQDERSRDAWNCLAATHLKQRAFNPARKALERVLQQMDKHDPYALVALGNIYIELARGDRTRSDKATEHYKRAGEFFSKALAVNAGNAYAAQGLGIILAEQDRLTDAKEAFTQVRAALGDGADTDATLNLAHVMAELGQFAGAVALYESVCAARRDERASGKFVALLLYQCRARYLLAGETGDWRVLVNAIASLRTALELLPHDLPLRFNLALALQRQAELLRSRADTRADIAIGRAAIAEAQSIYAKLEAKGKNIDTDIGTGIDNDNPDSNTTVAKGSSLDPKLTAGRVARCGAIAKDLDKCAAEQEKTLREQDDRLQQHRQQRETQQRQAQNLQEQREEDARLRSAEIEARRRDMAARMKETEEKVRAAATVSHPPRKPHSSDSEEHEEHDEKDEKPQASRRGKRTRETAPSEDETDGVTGRPRRRSTRATRSLSTLSKDFISDDDGDEDEAMKEESAGE